MQGWGGGELHEALGDGARGDQLGAHLGNVGKRVPWDTVARCIGSVRRGLRTAGSWSRWHGSRARWRIVRCPSRTRLEVLACLPPAMSAAVIATSDDERSLGAAWWHLHEPPLVMTSDDIPLPELTMAVAEDARGHGVGTALIATLVSNAATHSMRSL